MITDSKSDTRTEINFRNLVFTRERRNPRTAAGIDGIACACANIDFPGCWAAKYRTPNRWAGSPRTFPVPKSHMQLNYPAGHVPSKLVVRRALEFDGPWGQSHPLLGSYGFPPDIHTFWLDQAKIICKNFCITLFFKSNNFGKFQTLFHLFTVIRLASSKMFLSTSIKLQETILQER